MWFYLILLSLIYYCFYLIILVIVIGRYFLIADFFQLFFYRWQKPKWVNRRLSKKEVNKDQFRTEIKWSLITVFIFAFTGTITAILWQKGYTKLYISIDKYGLPWLPVSLLISILIRETYYYCLHRWMHRPSVFKLIHKTHHDSNLTSAWNAFSFHPLEGLLQAILLPVILIFLPMHISVFLLQLTLMTFSSVINHLEIETYPANFNKHIIGMWIIGATHHSLHHSSLDIITIIFYTLG